VIDRVAQKMGKRRFQPFQNIAIDVGIVAPHFKLYLFSEIAGQIAHHSRKTVNAVGKRSHPTG
jgi:hypothetical protein